MHYPSVVIAPGSISGVLARLLRSTLSLLIGNSSSLTPVGRLEVGSLWLLHVIHFGKIKSAGLITVWIVSVGVCVGVVVAVFVFQRLRERNENVLHLILIANLLFG